MSYAIISYYVRFKEGEGERRGKEAGVVREWYGIGRSVSEISSFG